MVVIQSQGPTEPYTQSFTVVAPDLFPVVPRTLLSPPSGNESLLTLPVHAGSWSPLSKGCGSR